MKLWKKLSALLLALTLSVPCALLTACKDGGDDNDGAGAGTEQGGGDNQGGGDEQGPTYQHFTYDTESTETPGSEYNRYRGQEGYYEIQLSAGTTKYYSFSVSQAGQYALVTLAKKDGVTIERCDASEHYIAPNTYPADVREDGTLYSPVHCSTSHYNTSWRATYKITTSVDGILKVRFYRFDEPLREPAHLTPVDVTANEIVGKAKEMDLEYVLKEVPYLASDNPSYFYDEDYEMTFTDLETGEEKTAKGFYRYGEESDENAPVIYVAINVSSRYLEIPFPQIIVKGGSFKLYDYTDDNGDYHYNDYTNFMLNNGGEIEYPDGTRNPVLTAGDEHAKCYMNVANEDGVYPVNQELFEFLTAYTKLNAPYADGATIDKEDYWLAPCFYYEKQLLLDVGENTVTANKTEVAYTLKVAEAGTYQIVGSENLYVYVNGINYGTPDNPFPITLEVPAEGITLALKARNAGEYTITITKVNE